MGRGDRPTSGRGPGLLAACCYTRRAEELDGHGPGRRPCSHRRPDPEVIRCAQALLAAIHRDMDGTSPGSSRFPAPSGPAWPFRGRDTKADATAVTPRLTL